MTEDTGSDDVDVAAIRARVATLIREQGMVYLGPCDDSPLPPFDGKTSIVMVEIRPGLYGMFRAGIRQAQTNE